MRSGSALLRASCLPTEFLSVRAAARWYESRAPSVGPASYLVRESFSTILVCQPGPDALHLAKTSCGRRSEIDARGVALLGRPRGRSNLRAIVAP